MSSQAEKDYASIPMASMPPRRLVARMGGWLSGEISIAGVSAWVEYWREDFGLGINWKIAGRWVCVQMGPLFIMFTW